MMRLRICRGALSLSIYDSDYEDVGGNLQDLK